MGRQYGSLLLLDAQEGCRQCWRTETCAKKYKRKEDKVPQAKRIAFCVELKQRLFLGLDVTKMMVFFLHFWVFYVSIPHILQENCT